MKGRINGLSFEADEFGFDGCHKIYLCDTEEGRRQLVEWDHDLLPIEDLPRVWAITCPLRFIMSGDLSKSYVCQFVPASFEGWDIDSDLQMRLDVMRDEQLAANMA